MDLDLDGMRVLVTGGAGGIGRATCHVLAAEGAAVAVHHHTATDASRLADDLGGVAVRADLADDEAVDQMVLDAAAGLGGIDALVANAGVWPVDDVPVWELPVERWRHTVEVDLTGTFLSVRAFLRTWAAGDRRRPPAIVLVGSTAGRFGEAGHGDYAAAKAGVQGGLLLSLKNEIVVLDPSARVNAVAPGWTVTPMTADELDEQRLAHATATVPLGKVADADDVARTIAWLLSPRTAGHLTGEVVTVAGGMEGRLLRDPRG